MSHEAETQRRYAVLKQLQGVPPDMQSQYLKVIALAKHADQLEQQLRAVEADMQHRTNWLDAALRGLWTPLEIALAQSTGVR